MSGKRGNHHNTPAAPASAAAQQIVLIGTPIEGFAYHGPFATLELAVQWGEDNSDGADWWVAELAGA